jgi:hypothetical protein
MNPSSRRSKTLAKLADSTHQHLSMYALAASAAGVGVLALASTAEAKIVYTPANVRILQNAGFFRFDLNHDAIPDFGLSNRYRTSSSMGVAILKAVPLRQANKIWDQAGNCGVYRCAAALPKGTKVGPNGRFQADYPKGAVMASTRFPATYAYGYWRGVTAYLGLKFVIKGKIHFGWARVNVTVRQPPQTGGVNATLTGYAYETIPNKPIIAGATTGRGDAEPATSLNSPIPVPNTLGTLALGAPGLSIWRRENLPGERR